MSLFKPWKCNSCRNQLCRFHSPEMLLVGGVEVVDIMVRMVDGGEWLGGSKRIQDHSGTAGLNQR